MMHNSSDFLTPGMDRNTMQMIVDKGQKEHQENKVPNNPSWLQSLDFLWWAESEVKSYNISKCKME